MCLIKYTCGGEGGNYASSFIRRQEFLKGDLEFCLSLALPARIAFRLINFLMALLTIFRRNKEQDMSYHCP